MAWDIRSDDGDWYGFGMSEYNDIVNNEYYTIMGQLTCMNPRSHAKLTGVTDPYIHPFIPFLVRDDRIRFVRKWRFNPRKKWSECIEKVYYLNL